MRRRLLTAALAIAILVPTGVALGAFTQTAHTRLTAHHSGQSSGLSVVMVATDPTAPGAKPRAVRSITLGFPRGTRFDLLRPGLRACRLSDHQLTTPFGPTCPRASRIGAVTAVANANPIAATVKEPGSLYVTGPKTLMIVLRPALPGAPVEIIRGSVSGATLVLHVPRVVWGKLVGVALVSLKLTVPAQGAGSTALITSGACRSGRFVIHERLVYGDRTSIALASGSACAG